MYSNFYDCGSLCLCLFFLFGLTILFSQYAHNSHIFIGISYIFAFHQIFLSFVQYSIEDTASILFFVLEKKNVIFLLYVYKQQPHLPIYTHKLALVFDCFAYAMVCVAFYAIFFNVSKKCLYVLSIECFTLRTYGIYSQCLTYMGFSALFRLNQCCQFQYECTSVVNESAFFLILLNNDSISWGNISNYL